MTDPSAVSRVRVRFTYAAYHETDARLLVEGATLHTFIDATGRPIRQSAFQPYIRAENFSTDSDSRTLRPRQACWQSLLWHWGNTLIG